MSDALIGRLHKAIRAALPTESDQNIVALLDFMHTQHSGSATNPDNTHRATQIVQHLRNQPYAASPDGVQALAALARHALAEAEALALSDSANTPERQLWLLASSSLNCAAAIGEFGDAAKFFETVERGGLERGMYFQRHYYLLAMKRLDAKVSQGAAEAGDQASESMRPLFAPASIFPAVVVVVLAAIAAYALVHMRWHESATDSHEPVAVHAGLQPLTESLSEGAGGELDGTPHSDSALLVGSG